MLQPVIQSPPELQKHPRIAFYLCAMFENSFVMNYDNEAMIRRKDRRKDTLLGGTIHETPVATLFASCKLLVSVSIVGMHSCVLQGLSAYQGIGGDGRSGSVKFKCLKIKVKRGRRTCCTFRPAFDGSKVASSTSINLAFGPLNHSRAANTTTCMIEV